MAVPVYQLVLVASCLLLGAGAILATRDREAVGRWLSAAGFAALSVVLGVLAAGYATSSRPDRHFLIMVSGVAFLLSLQGIRLVLIRWDRSVQLTTTVATVLLILLPFELFPVLQIIIQESLTSQVHFVLDTLGYGATIVPKDGAMMELRFENGGFYYISRECTGIDGVALFGGILIGARTTLRKKLGGLAFMLVAVYVVNILRLIFVSLAMANNWFGPLLTSENTIQMTYYVAEIAIGQSVVIIASIVGFLYVARWIPDLTDFAGELIDTFFTVGSDINARLDPF
jgi:archaeosortase A (PGF-CTERM-specific)